MTRSLLHAAAAAVLLSACATVRDSPRGASPAGQTLQMTAANGQVTTLRFGGGSVRATFSGRSLEGRWRLSDGRLCFFWPRAQPECWPHTQGFERGRTRTITSDRGNVIRVTRL